MPGPGEVRLAGRHFGRSVWFMEIATTRLQIPDLTIPKVVDVETIPAPRSSAGGR
jgi:hypothetical protein